MFLSPFVITEQQDTKEWHRGSRMAAVHGCGLARIYGGHGGLNTFKKALRGSRGRRGGSIPVTPCTHKGLTHPAKTPALKVCRGPHTAASWQCWGCISAAGKSLFTPHVPTTRSVPTHIPAALGPHHSSGSPSLSSGSSGGEIELDWQEAPGAGNDNVSTHLSVIKSCV